MASQNKELELIQKALDSFPSILRKKARATRARAKVMKNFLVAAREFQSFLNKQEEMKTRSHPWRFCPLGSHWVRHHRRALPDSGGLTSVRGHCRRNQGKKEELSTYEMQEIARRYFDDLIGPPDAKNLGFAKKGQDGNRYDSLIRGWTKFWNDIFKPDLPLDPNLVKALIASESGFREKVTTRVGGSKKNFARGIAQLTDQTIQVLGDPRGELKNHLIPMKKADALDPNIAICAAIRWLFHKRESARRKLRREPSWDEAIAEYKSYLKDLIRDPKFNDRGMKVFRDYYGMFSK